MNLSDKKFLKSQGLVWGRLLASLELAKEAVGTALASSSVLPEAEVKLLRDAHELLDAAEQRAWSAQQASWKELK